MATSKAEPNLTPRSPRVEEIHAIQRKAFLRQKTYGTFHKESIHGRLFELNTYLECVCAQVPLYIWTVFAGTLLWPVAWLVAGCTYRGAASHQRKDLQILTMFLILATAVGLLLWLLPLILITIDGGPHRYWRLVHHEHAMSSADFLNLVKAELIFLFFITFSYIFHDISVDVGKYKNDVLKSWQGRHGEVGMEVVLSEEQMEHLRPGLANAPNKGEGMFIEDMLYMLKGMPGWDSDSDLKAPDFWEKLLGSPRSFFTKLREHCNDAEKRGLWSLDVFVFWSQYHEKATPLHIRMRVTYHKLLSTWSWLLEELLKQPVMCFLIFLLAVIRSIIPRVWTWGVLGGKFLPSEPCPMVLSLWSTFVFFLISFMWLGLFYLMVLEYRKQLCQVVLVSATVDPTMRMTYMKMYLKHETVEEKHEAEQIMCNLPLLNLKVESNLTAFWKLRDYCTLDRSNERIGMHVLMDLVVFWFTLNLIVALSGLFIFQTLPPTAPVMIFDILTFGGVMIWALEGAMRVNQYLDDHEQLLKQARYDLCMDWTQMEFDAEQNDSNSEKLAKINKRTFKLLDQHVSMIESRQQGRDKILLGLEVTPAKLFSASVSIFLALLTISLKLHSLGVFDTIKDNMLGDQKQASTSLMQMVQHLPDMQFLQKLRGLKT
jgi:hypothetical protein